MEKYRFSMPWRLKLFACAFSLFVVIVVGVIPPRSAGSLVGSGLTAALICTVAFGRRVVLRAEGISYGYFFIARRPVPWEQISSISVVSRISLKGTWYWQVSLTLQSGGALLLPVPYSVGAKPDSSFEADFRVIQQHLHSGRAHAKALARRAHRHPDH